MQKEKVKETEREGEKGAGGTEKGWNCDTDPASSCFAVKTPGGKQE